MNDISTVLERLASDRMMWVFALIVLAGCKTPAVSPTPPLATQPPLAATATDLVTRPFIVATSTETAVPTPQQTETPTTQPTPSIGAAYGTRLDATPAVPVSAQDYRCPVPGRAAPFSAADSDHALRKAVLNFLNAGGGWEELLLLLATQNVEASIVKVDFNGDAVNEVVMNVALNLPDYERDSATWVLQCRSGEYETIFDVSWGMYHYGERVAEITDLTNDGLPEVIIESLFVGSACTYELTIIGWQPSEGIVDYSPSHLELDLGCGGEIIIEELNGDNVQEITIAGGTVGHLSHAPLREITQTYQLIDQTYHLVSTEYGPSDIRVHIFDDAQRALDSRDFLLAAQLYDQSAHDESLFSVPSRRYGLQRDSLDRSEEYQRAFALFRLAVVQYILGNTNGVADTFDELNVTFPEGSLGGEFTVLAHLYIEKRESGLTAVQACRKVTTYTNNNFPYLGNHIGEWGVNIAYYTNETLCPPLSLPAP